MAASAGRAASRAAGRLAGLGIGTLDAHGDYRSNAVGNLVHSLFCLIVFLHTFVAHNLIIELLKLIVKLLDLAAASLILGLLKLGGKRHSLKIKLPDKTLESLVGIVASFAAR